MGTMGKKMMIYVLPVILRQLTPEVIKKAADAILDVIEDGVANSKTKADDKIVLPLCAKIREAFDIPDNDE